MNMEQKSIVAGWSRRRQDHSGDRGREVGAAVLRGDELTHDVFEVVEGERGRGKWNLVGEVTKDELCRQLVGVRGGAKRREMELVVIDRSERAIPAGKDATRYPTHDLFADGGF